jgi:hypothetical protein
MKLQRNQDTIPPVLPILPKGRPHPGHPDGWLNDTVREAVRQRADRAVRGDEEGRRPPNCVIAFCERHHIPLDTYDHRVSAIAVRRALRLTDDGRGLAS